MTELNMQIDPKRINVVRPSDKPTAPVEPQDNGDVTNLPTFQPANGDTPSGGGGDTPPPQGGGGAIPPPGEQPKARQYAYPGGGSATTNTGATSVTYFPSATGTSASTTPVAITSTVGSTDPVAEAGWQTTEFWVTVVAQFISLLTLLGVIHPSNAQTDALVGFVGLVGPAIAYAISRGIRKVGTTA